MSDCEMPSRFLFEGEFEELDVSLAVFAGVDDLFLLDRTTPTGITMASMTIRMMPTMPGEAVSDKSYAPSNTTYQSSFVSASVLRPPRTQHCQHHPLVVLSDRPAQLSHRKAQRHVRDRSH